MNNLRLILLLLGIAVIAGIFLWDNIQRRKEKRLRTIEISRPRATPPSIPVHPRDETRADASALADVRPVPDRNLDEDYSDLSMSPHNDQSVPGQKAGAAHDLFGDAAGPERPELQPNQIIILHITARFGQQFSGEEIIQALEQLGFQFGKMNIFHHYGLDGVKSEHPLFSVVNMVEPGHFNPDTIERLSTPGISLFLCLPAPVGAERVFDFMLSIASQLAALLDGEVRSENHKLLDKAAIAAIKNRIKLIRSG